MKKESLFYVILEEDLGIYFERYFFVNGQFETGILKLISSTIKKNFHCINV